MTMVSGRYVAKFAEASHALPDNMPMNADYPFMLPRVVKIEQRGRKRAVTISNGREEVTMLVAPLAQEFGFIEQRSTFEHMLGRKPTRFKMRPFRDDSTPCVSAPDKPSDSQPSTADATPFANSNDLGGSPRTRGEERRQ